MEAEFPDRAEEPVRALGSRAALIATAVGGTAALGGSMVAGIGTMLLVVAAGEVSPEAASTSLPVLLASIVTSSLLLLATALITPKLLRSSVRESLGLTPVASGWIYLLAVIGTLALGPVSDVLMQTMARVAPDFTFGGMDALIELMRQGSPWVLLPIVALLPGLAEELFFRGMLQRALGTGTKAIVISALLFALFHLDPHHVAGVLPLGFFLAWVAARTGSTWPCVLAHVTNNAAALAASRIAPLELGYGTDRPMPWEAAAAGLLLAGLIAWALHQTPRRLVS